VFELFVNIAKFIFIFLEKKKKKRKEESKGTLVLRSLDCV